MFLIHIYMHMKKYVGIQSGLCSRNRSRTNVTLVKVRVNLNFDYRMCLDPRRNFNRCLYVVFGLNWENAWYFNSIKIGKIRFAYTNTATIYTKNILYHIVYRHGHTFRNLYATYPKQHQPTSFIRNIQQYSIFFKLKYEL